MQYAFSNTPSSDLITVIFSTQSFCSSENDSSCPDTIRVRGVVGKTTTENLGSLLKSTLTFQALLPTDSYMPDNDLCPKHSSILLPGCTLLQALIPMECLQEGCLVWSASGKG